MIDDSLALMPEFESRIEVLTKMNYIDADRTVQLKVLSSLFLLILHKIFI